MDKYYNDFKNLDVYNLHEKYADAQHHCQKEGDIDWYIIKVCEKIMKERNIDKNIYELVYHFNRLGLKTIFSCEGHGTNKPYIMFDCDRKIVNDLLKKLYNKFSKGNYLDIGEFNQRCEPSFNTNNNFIIHNNWIWEGSYWDKEDYIFKINRFCDMLKEIEND